MKQFSIFILFLLISCSTTKISKNQKFTLRLLHTNDHHGHYLADSDDQFGMAARKTLIDELRKNILNEKGSSLLLSGGDINTGTMESDMFDAEPDFLGMKLLGYDAMAVGNHEFDNSFGVLQQQMKWASFPFLAANIYYKGTQKRVFKPYIVREVQGVKIGIFGLTTKDTPFKASHEDSRKLFDFKNIIDSAKEIVPVLKNKEKVDLVIAITHIGHYGSRTSRGDVDLAKAVGGIDVIIGGHSQEIINAEVHNGAVIVQAEDWGKYVGVLDLNISNQNNVISHNYRLIPVNLKRKVGGQKRLIEKEIKKDPTLVQFFSTYKFKAEKLGNTKVGKILQELPGERKLVRSTQVALGQFVGESVRNQVKGIDVVVLNGGSIRSTLKKGEITRKDIHNVHPFGNTISLVTFNADEFFNYMSEVAKFLIVDPQNIIGGYPQLTGMKVTLKAGELTKIEAISGIWKIEKIAGKIKYNKKEFVVGTMNFLAKGGDNYPLIIKHKTFVDTGFMLNAAMINYVESKREIETKKFFENIKGIITIL